MKTLLRLPAIDGIPVSLNLEAETKRSEVLKLASGVVEVKQGQQLQLSVNNRTAIKTLIKDAEACCELEKKPFYDRYKMCLSIKDEYILPLIEEDKRLKKLNDDYATAEAERVRLENIRIEQVRQEAARKLQAELDEQNRLARLEQERIRKETERLEQEQKAAQKRLDDAKAETERLAALSRPSAKNVVAAAKAVEQAAAQVQQVAAVKTVAVNVAQEIASENKVQQAADALRQVQTQAPAKMTRAAGMRVRTLVKFEVTDAAALYAVRPEFFELVEKKSIINACINKTTVLPGLKVWEAIET